MHEVRPSCRKGFPCEACNGLECATIVAVGWGRCSVRGEDGHVTVGQWPSRIGYIATAGAGVWRAARGHRSLPAIPGVAPPSRSACSLCSVAWPGPFRRGLEDQTLLRRSPFPSLGQTFLVSSTSPLTCARSIWCTEVCVARVWASGLLGHIVESREALQYSRSQHQLQTRSDSQMRWSPPAAAPLQC